jgi:hypothetical protein
LTLLASDCVSTTPGSFEKPCHVDFESSYSVCNRTVKNFHKKVFGAICASA